MECHVTHTNSHTLGLTDTKLNTDKPYVAVNPTTEMESLSEKKWAEAIIVRTIIMKLGRYVA